MKRPGILAQIDRATNGALAVQVRQYRTDGVSFEEIAHKLRADGIQASSETVRQWVKQLDAEVAAA